MTDGQTKILSQLASVGLAQAHPNNYTVFLVMPINFICQSTLLATQLVSATVRAASFLACKFVVQVVWGHVFQETLVDKCLCYRSYSQQCFNSELSAWPEPLLH